jgi:hypothetical protein
MNLKMCEIERVAPYPLDKATHETKTKKVLASYRRDRKAYRMGREKKIRETGQSAVDKKKGKRVATFREEDLLPDEWDLEVRMLAVSISVPFSHPSTF